MSNILCIINEKITIWIQEKNKHVTNWLGPLYNKFIKKRTKSTGKKRSRFKIGAKKREPTIKINSDSPLNGLRFRPLIAIENRCMHFKLKSWVKHSFELVLSARFSAIYRLYFSSFFLPPWIYQSNFNCVPFYWNIFIINFKLPFWRQNQSNRSFPKLKHFKIQWKYTFFLVSTSLSDIGNIHVFPRKMLLLYMVFLCRYCVYLFLSGWMNLYMCEIMLNKTQTRQPIFK